MILIIRKIKLRFRENWPIFWEIWEKSELLLGILGAKTNTFKETRTLFAGRRGDQCIIFRDQASTDPLWGPHLCKGPQIDLKRGSVSVFLKESYSHLCFFQGAGGSGLPVPFRIRTCIARYVSVQ